MLTSSLIICNKLPQLNYLKGLLFFLNQRVDLYNGTESKSSDLEITYYVTIPNFFFFLKMVYIIR